MITADDLKQLLPEQIEEYNERAEIAEYDGKMKRTEAEIFSYNQIMWRDNPSC